jgi:CheY-like chemotaxis protein
MARIVILEPDSQVRELIVDVARRLGHVPVAYDPALAAEIGAGDVVVVEPGDADALEAALALRRRLPALPMVCVSIYRKAPSAAALRPIAYVRKPFLIAELEQALNRAVEQTIDS